jgi:putative FmdB family regulatory protein
MLFVVDTIVWVKEALRTRGNWGMPIYEYRCNRCKKEFSQLCLNPKAIAEMKCKFCSGTDLTRLLSTFCVHQTEESRLADFDTSAPRTHGFYKDSRNVGLWTKKRMKQMGVDLGSKLDEVVEKGRTGKILNEYGK